MDLFFICIAAFIFVIVVVSIISTHLESKREQEERARRVAEKEARDERIRKGLSRLEYRKVTKPCIITKVWGTAPERNYVDPLDCTEHYDKFYMKIWKPNGTTETKRITNSEYRMYNEGDHYGTMEVMEEVEVPIVK